MENLLIECGGKSASLFGPTHLWNLLKITTLIVYLALLVYLAPESKEWFQGHEAKSQQGYSLIFSKVLQQTNKINLAKSQF